MCPEADQILYTITIFYAQYSLLTILHNFLTPRWAIFIGFSGYPIKKSFQKHIVPILAAFFFSERNSEYCQKQPVQKFYDDNDLV